MSKVGPESDKGHIITELSNKPDVMAKLALADERILQALADKGFEPTLEAAKQRVKQSLKPKEIEVSGEVIENPQDSAIVDLTKKVVEDMQVFNEATRSVTETHPSLLGRVTVGTPKYKGG